jgi:glucose dehydrogenase
VAVQDRQPGSRPEYKLEGTPVVVNGRLYTTAGTRRSVIALDAATGELLWVHRYPEGVRGVNAPRQLSGRGLAYWTDGRGDERILYMTPGYRLIALNAKTGQPIPGFGKDGVVDLKVGVVYGTGQQIDLDTGEIGVHSTPVIVKDTVLVGSAMKEGMTVHTSNNTKGLARAFDVRTGKLIWAFNTIPKPGELGNDTWLNNSWAINGNTGVWTQITVDEELGLVYLPVEDPTSDYYGGKRPGNNLFGESLVCVDLATGKRKWHFQFEHHPIWDHDISSAPIIADVTVNGRPRKVVAVPSKQAWLWVFDRVTGEPIWPIEEKAVPKGDVPGEWLADAAASAGGAHVRAQLRPLPRRSHRLHAGAARAGRAADQALSLLQRRRLQPADGRRRERPPRRDHDGRGERRHELAGRRLRSRDAHGVRAGRDGVDRGGVRRAAAGGFPISPIRRRRRTGIHERLAAGAGTSGRRHPAGRKRRR